MTSAGGIAKLERLRDAAVAAFGEVPGVQAVLGVGSLATGNADEFSDVDLEVIVDDRETVAPEVFGSLRRVGDLSFVYPLDDDPAPAGVIAFYGEFGYFNKLDVAVATAPKFGTDAAVELFRRSSAEPSRGGGAGSGSGWAIRDRRFSDAVLTGLRAIKYMKRGQWLPANHLYRSLTSCVIDRFVASVLGEPGGAHVAELVRLSAVDFDQRGRVLAVARSAPSEAGVLELLRLLRHTGSAAPGPGEQERNFLRKAIAFVERHP